MPKHPAQPFIRPVFPRSLNSGVITQQIYREDRSQSSSVSATSWGTIVTITLPKEIINTEKIILIGGSIQWQAGGGGSSYVDETRILVNGKVSGVTYKAPLQPTTDPFINNFSVTNLNADTIIQIQVYNSSGVLVTCIVDTISIEGRFLIR